MKKFAYILVILALTLIGCNGQTASDKPARETRSSTDIKEDNNPSPVHLTREQFLKQVMNYEINQNTWVFEGEKPCLVDFYADWCAPCRITSPILEDLARQYEGRINFYKVNVDSEQELASVFGIQSIPTFLFCPLNGDPVMSSGIASTPAATKEMFIKQIEELLLKNETKPTI